MKYHHQTDGEWVEFKNTPAKMMCCDCGLVHKMFFRVSKGKLQLWATRDARATGAARRRLQRVKV